MTTEQLCKIDGCDKPKYKKGWCSSHYQRWYRNGDPVAYKRAPNGLPERWLRGSINYTGDNCLIWPFSLDGSGYGMINIEGTPKTASRFMCELVHGSPPTSKHQSAHNCGNRPCCNPNHLRWATPQENMADKLIHDTHSRGTRNGNSKLTESEVLEIRSLHHLLTYKRIASMYDVSLITIRDIVLRRTWVWLEE